MPTGSGGFTVQDDDAYVRESLYIEAGLSRALDDEPGEPPGDVLTLDSAALRARAQHVYATEGPAAARRMLLKEAGHQRRWLRAVELGLAGNDATGPEAQAALMGGALAQIMLEAALRGIEAGLPPERMATEAAAAAALDAGTETQALALQVLSLSYRLQQRPELALSVLLRGPTGDSPGRHLLFVLDAARQAHTLRRGQVAELLALSGWPCDPTGLVRELLHRLVDEQVPTDRELAARVARRRAAFEAGDWTALRELALSDVVWLEEDATLWRALSAILRAYGAADQAGLAGAVADELALRQGP
ncbi:hypothetical protein AB0I98_00760 [Streptomyces sp. NPDC050211]|uniref:hypothetical protein n=1 Tax=Streptomyces sp. NPDC050211 TaxID=3154932 RepID=UPI00342027C3